MAWTVFVILILWAPSLTVGQDYRVYYHCDFETGDCGLKNISFTGAFFKHRFVDLGQRRTRCLVLEDLPSFSNWTYGRIRSASVSTPVVFPVSGPLSVSLEYYMVKGHCVDYLEMSQQYGNYSQPLQRVNTPSNWNTMTAVLTNPGQPVKVVVEARLQPSCQDPSVCQCANMVAIDNLRIQGTGGVAPPPNPNPNPSPSGRQASFHQWWQYYHHWIKKLRKTWPPQPPPCPDYYPCNTTTIYIPCPPVPPPSPCPPPPPFEPCPPCPPGNPRPCPPQPPCPPIKPCPPRDFCYPPEPTDKPGHNLPPWDPFLHSRNP